MVREATTLTPRVRQATTLTPRVGEATGHTPRVRQATTFTPRVRQATGHTPRVRQATTLTPRVREATSLTPRVSVQLEYQRQQLLQERQQFHLEQIRAAEYRARQIAMTQLAAEQRQHPPTASPDQG